MQLGSLARALGSSRPHRLDATFRVYLSDSRHLQLYRFGKAFGASAIEVRRQHAGAKDR